MKYELPDRPDVAALSQSLRTALGTDRVVVLVGYADPGGSYPVEVKPADDNTTLDEAMVRQAVEKYADSPPPPEPAPVPVDQRVADLEAQVAALTDRVSALEGTPTN